MSELPPQQRFRDSATLSGWGLKSRGWGTQSPWTSSSLLLEPLSPDKGKPRDWESGMFCSPSTPTAYHSWTPASFLHLPLWYVPLPLPGLNYVRTDCTQPKVEFLL